MAIVDVQNNGQYTHTKQVETKNEDGRDRKRENNSIIRGYTQSTIFVAKVIFKARRSNYTSIGQTAQMRQT